MAPANPSGWYSQTDTRRSDDGKFPALGRRVAFHPLLDVTAATVRAKAEAADPPTMMAAEAARGDADQPPGTAPPGETDSAERSARSPEAKRHRRSRPDGYGDFWRGCGWCVAARSEWHIVRRGP